MLQLVSTQLVKHPLVMAENHVAESNGTEQNAGLPLRPEQRNLNHAGMDPGSAAQQENENPRNQAQSSTWCGPHVMHNPQQATRAGHERVSLQAGVINDA